jgi:pyrimidine-specific ribonucleoside hydrolase
MNSPIDVLLDVDTGVDDALALLVAARHPRLRLRAVTCVAGNTSLANVVRNTRAVLAVAGASDVPVGAGADRPLMAPHRGSSLFHGADGLGGVVLPAPPLAGDLPNAIDLMRRAIAESPRKPTLLALGPLTNLALLVRTAPALTEHIERIVFMGGSAGVGNATAVAEFNLWSDPEAAAIVLTAGCPITMYGLDVFYDVVVGAADIDSLAAASGPPAQLAGRLLTYLSAMDRIEGRVSGTATTIGDAGAVCAVVDSDALSTQRFPVSVVLDGQAARGQTIVDRRARAGEGDVAGATASSRIDVATGVAAGRLRRVFLDGLGLSWS